MKHLISAAICSVTLLAAGAVYAQTTGGPTNPRTSETMNKMDSPSHSGAMMHKSDKMKKGMGMNSNNGMNGGMSNGTDGDKSSSAMKQKE